MQFTTEKIDLKRLEIARHEAGHAVMMLICNREIEIVSLREMDSPRGTDKYRGFTKPKPLKPGAKFTGKEVIGEIAIALGGYASEIVFSRDGSIKVGCDDLTRAVEWTEKLLQDEGFRNWTATLRAPEPGVLDMIADPRVRAYINLKLDECVRALASRRSAINLIAERLYESEELTGNEVVALFNSFIQSGSGAYLGNEK